MKDAIFLGFNFQQFSDLVSFAVLSMFTLNVLFLIVYFTKSKLSIFIKNLIHKNAYDVFMYKIITVLGVGIVGANIYEIVYGDMPCILCWYQRVLIYPMFIIAVSELYFKTKIAHKFIAVLAFLTAIVGAYHYRFHYIRYVLGDTVSVPCSSNTLLPTCGEAGVVSYGFMTMPLMSVVIGVYVLTICYVLSKKSK